jgi:hypothetical protein
MSKVFLCASDPAYADNLDKKSPQAGCLFRLFGGPIDWKAGKQKTIATSTTEAELLAISSTTRESYWWQRLFRDIGLVLDYADVSMKCDNAQTVGLLTKEEPELNSNNGTHAPRLDVNEPERAC